MARLTDFTSIKTRCGRDLVAEFVAREVERFALQLPAQAPACPIRQPADRRAGQFLDRHLGKDPSSRIEAKQYLVQPGHQQAHRVVGLNFDCLRLNRANGLRSHHEPEHPAGSVFIQFRQRAAEGPQPDVRRMIQYLKSVAHGTECSLAERTQRRKLTGSERDPTPAGQPAEEPPAPRHHSTLLRVDSSMDNAGS